MRFDGFVKYTVIWKREKKFHGMLGTNSNFENVGIFFTKFCAHLPPLGGGEGGGRDPWAADKC
jgi:hypothetical protein